MNLTRISSLAVAAFALLLSLPNLASGASRVRKGPWAQQVTATSALVRVEVDPPAPARLELVLLSVDGGTTLESRETRALHAFALTGLEPATRYPFVVRVDGASTPGSLTTAPSNDSTDSFRFLIYGDNRTDDAAHASVVRAMTSVASDFLLHTGDMVANGGSKDEWQSFFDIENPLLRNHPLFSCVGNHELVDGAGADYVGYFGPSNFATTTASKVGATLLTESPAARLTLEQLSGTFRWANARFFLLNGMVAHTGGPSRVWLERVLNEADAEAGLTWRIVVVHHGPWSSGPHGENLLLQQAKIPDLLRAHKVDLVISGHDHIYERGVADGLPYLLSGGGGAPVYRVIKASATSRRYESVRHFVEASVSPAALRFGAVRPDGSTIERCALLKGTGWDCDGDASVVNKTEVHLEREKGIVPVAGSGTGRCTCRAVGVPPASGKGGLMAIAVAVALGVIRSAARPRQGKHARDDDRTRCRLR